MVNIPKNLLKNLNLTELQAKVYLAALELGQALMQELTRKSGVKRTSIYNFIGELKERGLIIETRKNKRSMYSAAHPSILIEMEKTRVKELELILPELSAIANNVRNKPKVTFYEGREGIYEVYLDTLKERQPIIAWSDFEHMKPVMGKDFMVEYPKERARRSITFRCITKDTPITQEVARRNYGELREMKLIDTEHLETEINVYGNKVAQISFRSNPPFAVLIEDKGIAQTLRVAWNELWNRL